MSKLQYAFASTHNGMEDGFNALSSRFKGRYSYFLVRESIQNALDQPNGQEPVRVAFSLSSISAQKIPDSSQLAKIMTACFNWKWLQGNNYAKSFYKNAYLNVVNNSSISMLKISDYNTTGFDDNGYHAFFRSIGLSTKSQGGGSWGLGKESYFASSSFHTIFVSSVRKDGQRLFQGKLFLSSWVDENGDTKRGTGSYGLENERSVTSEEDIPETFRRNEQGTDFYIVGFIDKSDWKNQIMLSVLDNFWVAISDGKLVVEIGNKTIDQGNIEELINDLFSEGGINKNGIEINPLPFFRAYKNENHIVYTGNKEDYPTLGAMKLYILLGENFPNKIAYARFPRMIVQVKPYYIPKSHSAFFICDNKQGDAVLRDMENPEHDKWSVTNAKTDLTTGKPFPKYVRADQELKDFIRKSFDELTKEDVSTELDIKGMENYLWLPAEENTVSGSEHFLDGDLGDKISEKETGSETGSEEDDRFKAKIKIRPLPRIVTEKQVEIDENGDTDVIDGGNGGNGDEPFTKKGFESENGENRKVLIPIKYRTFAPTSKQGLINHILIIRGTGNTNCDIELKAGTDNSFLPIRLKEATGPNGEKMKVEDNILKGISLGPDGVTKLNVIFKEPGKFSLKAEAYASS